MREFPELGRRVPERPDGDVRELIVPPYRILNEFEDDTVTVLTIVHGQTLGTGEDDGD